MRIAFVDHVGDDEPGDDDKQGDDGHERKYFAPFNHLPNQVPLDKGVAPAAATAASVGQTPAVALWPRPGPRPKCKSLPASRPSLIPNPDTVNHLNWYEATNFTRAYPGEKYVRPPSQFKNRFAQTKGDLDN